MYLQGDSEGVSVYTKFYVFITNLQIMSIGYIMFFASLIFPFPKHSMIACFLGDSLYIFLFSMSLCWRAVIIPAAGGGFVAYIITLFFSRLVVWDCVSFP